MTLNIDPSKKALPGRKADDASVADTKPLVAEVIDELSSWSPREFITTFQRWHHGSVSLIHLNVLAMLEGHGPLPMSRLAESLDISVASMTGVIDRMEKRGLVERRHDAEDRRVVLVHPASGASQLFTDIDGRRRAGLAKVLDHLSDEDLEALLRGHRALRAARLAFAQAREDAS
ncbi:MAG: MarR family transcriptional regulator [Chloroflexi bacterium]|nr:MarR family transcriptional regulator [Chloroflexota bacterium]